MLTFWGLADYEVNEILEVFAERTPCLFDESSGSRILKVVPVDFEFPTN